MHRSRLIIWICTASFLLSLTVIFIQFSTYEVGSKTEFFNAPWGANQSYSHPAEIRYQVFKKMDDRTFTILTGFVMAILGGIISAAVGLLAFIYQRQLAARHVYYVSMCDLGCRAIEAAKQRRAPQFHLETLDEVRKVVLGLSPFLWFKGDALLAQWIRYSQLTSAQLEEESEIERFAATAASELPPPRVSRILEIHFGIFIRIVRNKKGFIGFRPEEEIDPAHPDFKG